jgi:hypothetical protein
MTNLVVNTVIMKTANAEFEYHVNSKRDRRRARVGKTAWIHDSMRHVARLVFLWLWMDVERKDSWQILSIACERQGKKCVQNTLATPLFEITARRLCLHTIYLWLWMDFGAQTR